MKLNLSLWIRTEVAPIEITNEIDRLFKTGQIKEEGGFVVLGVPIFEAAKPVSKKAEKSAREIYKNLEDRRGIKRSLMELDHDVKEELLNTIASIIDNNFKRIK